MTDSTAPSEGARSVQLRAALLMKIYEPKKELCHVCKERDSIFLPICEVDGVVKMIPVCRECRPPYPVIPVKTSMSKGYYYFEGEWHEGR